MIHPISEPTVRGDLFEGWSRPNPVKHGAWRWGGDYSYRSLCGEIAINNVATHRMFVPIGPDICKICTALWWRLPT